MGALPRPFTIGGGPCCRPSGTPIIIDVDGNGFHLTSVEDGVVFDFFGSGRPVQIAWTSVDSTNAFLIRDLYGDGIIVDAKEMFGNLTEQPSSPDPNGFNALAQYDDNKDGWIDSNDAVWPTLLLWQDANHNGISERGELHTLESFEIKRISVKYKTEKRIDRYGNVFRYRSAINDETKDRWVYDVMLNWRRQKPVNGR